MSLHKQNFRRSYYELREKCFKKLEFRPSLPKSFNALDVARRNTTGKLRQLPSMCKINGYCLRKLKIPLLLVAGGIITRNYVVR